MTGKGNGFLTQRLSSQHQQPTASDKVSGESKPEKSPNCSYLNKYHKSYEVSGPLQALTSRGPRETPWCRPHFWHPNGFWPFALKPLSYLYIQVTWPPSICLSSKATKNEISCIIFGWYLFDIWCDCYLQHQSRSKAKVQRWSGWY